MKISAKTKSNILLLITAFIWGTAFIAQKKGVGVLKPNTFNGIRTLCGCVALLPVIFFRQKLSGESQPSKSLSIKNLAFAGIVCGILLCTAGTVQTYGLLYADAGKAGFITALYIIIVPILGIFIGKKIRPITVIAVVLATVGLYFLCVKGSSLAHLNRGDLLLLVCAFVFSLHILAIDWFSPKVDGVLLSFTQFLVSGTINIIIMLLIEKPAFVDILSCAVPILYAGVMSCGVAYTLQVVAQKDADPAVASILMSMESLFAFLAGIAFGERPHVNEVFGCLLMLVAIIAVQLPERRMKNE